MKLKQRVAMRSVILMALYLSFSPASSAESLVSYQGKACTGSELWSLGKEILRKNKNWNRMLTVAPKSAQAGAVKFRQLQRYSKELNQTPGMEGAWAYWYYRAAFSMKMVAYAEAGLIDLEKKLPEGNPFKAASKSCVEVIQASFKGFDQTSAYVVYNQDDLEYFKALDGPDLGKIYRSFRKVYESSKKLKSDQKSDSVLILYAEELYKRGKFTDAIKSARVIGKQSQKYAAALLVMAWSAFRMKDYALAVGHSFSLMKSYPQTIEAYESIWLASAALLESCLEREAQRTLYYFKSQILELDRWIKANEPEMQRDPVAFYQKHIQDPKVPGVIKKEWLKSGRLFVLQSHLNSLIDERDRVQKWKKWKNFYRVKEIEKQVNALYSYYESELGKEFLRMLPNQKRQLDSFVEKGQLLETDILSIIGQTELMEEGHVAVADDKKTTRFTKKVVWVRSGYAKGIADNKEEVWLDDIGNFVGNFKNACKR